MKLTTITGVTNTIIDSATIGDKLIFEITDTAGNNVDYTLPQLTAYVHRPTGGVRKKIHDFTRLIDLAEICAINKNQVIRKEFTETVAGGVGTLKCTKAILEYDLSELGLGIKLEQDDVLRLEFIDIVATTSIDVYHLETKEGTGSHKYYEIVTTDSTPNRKIHPDAETSAIAIRKGGNFVDVEVKFKGAGQIIRMSPEELEIHLRNEVGHIYNEKITLADGTRLTNLEENTEENYLIPCHEVEYVQVNTNGNNVIILVERTKEAHKAIQHLQAKEAAATKGQHHLHAKRH